MSQIAKIPPEYLQVLAHFYRGEVYRSAIWRTRLDVTTNWAILAVTATFSWAFTADTKSHIIFPMTTLMVLLLLCIESRRYRYYDVWWTRARMLEAHLIVPALNPDLHILQGNWRQVLSDDMLLPTYKISFVEAFARRLSSNYIWLFLLLFFGWLLRVYTRADEDGDQRGDLEVSWSEFYQECGYKVIEPYVILSVQCAFLVFIVAFLVIMWNRRHVSGEIRRRDPRAPRWPI